jgi:hypothetical protein
MQRSIAAIALIAAALFTPPPATAGGWWTWTRLDRSKVEIGQKVTARADVMFSSVEAAEAARSGREDDAFYVYLLRGFDYSSLAYAMQEASPGKWWSRGSARVHRVGRVTFEDGDFNLARATSSFRVPEAVPPGKYAVMLCDAGCAHPMADVIPTGPNALTVAPAPAQIAGASPWVYAGSLAAGIVLGALLVGFMLGRQTLARTALEPGWQPSDEDLAELIARQRRERERRTARIA